MAVLFTASKFSATDASGAPLAGGLVYTYQAGTLTPAATYTTQAGNVANTNPVVLDSSGRASIWLSPSTSYRIIVKDSGGVTMPDGDVDNINANAEFLDRLAQSDGSSLIGFLDRTVEDKLLETVVTPEDFGAVGAAIGGTATDQTTALTAFFNSVNANPGVQHVLPPKLYGITAQLPRLKVSGFRVRGSGLSMLHNVGSIAAGTTIKWIGSATANAMQEIYPDTGASAQCLDGCEFMGIFYDANNLADKGIVAKSIRASHLQFMGANAVVTHTTLDVLGSSTLGENEGLQSNVIDVSIRQIEAASGVALRLKGSATANVSLNLFRRVEIIHMNASAIIEENADNNLWEWVRCYAAGSATYSVEWLGGATESVSCRGERFNKLTANKAAVGRGTGTYTYPATNNIIDSLDIENATPVPVWETGATGMWADTRGVFGGSGTGFMSLGAALGDNATNVLAARTRAGSSNSLHIANGSNDHVQLSDAANSNRWSVNIDSSGNMRFLRSAGTGLYQDTIAAYGNYANDAAAATGGVPVGGRYRNGSVMMIRVS